MRLLLLLCLITVSSCANKEPVPIDISHIDNLASSPKWAVITEVYATYLSEPNTNANTVAYGRTGDILAVEGIEIGPHENWYKFEQGWLPKSSVTIYSNKLQATAAAHN